MAPDTYLLSRADAEALSAQTAQASHVEPYDVGSEWHFVCDDSGERVLYPLAEADADPDFPAPEGWAWVYVA